MIKQPADGKITISIDGSSYDLDKDGKVFKSGSTTQLKKKDLPGGTGDDDADADSLKGLVKAGSTVLYYYCW